MLLHNLLVHREIISKKTVTRYILSGILNIFLFAFKFIARTVLFQRFILFVRNCKMMPIFKRFARFFYGFLGFAFTFFLAMLPDVVSNSIFIYILTLTVCLNFPGCLGVQLNFSFSIIRFNSVSNFQTFFSFNFTVVQSREVQISTRLL